MTPAEGRPEGRIIVKRGARKRRHAAHGGAWKIAYADFMTAMMAFFLVMWVVTASHKEEFAGIADMFKSPLKLAISGGPKTSNASTVIPGGGTDLTRKDGEVNRSDGERLLRSDDVAEAMRLVELKDALDRMIESSPELRNMRAQLSVEFVPEGLRVQVVDSQNRPMFENGRAVILPHMRTILHEIAPTLSALPNQISIAGHTDDRSYAAGQSGYSNWELSAERANASRRELITGGLAADKIVRVIGLADTQAFDAGSTSDPANRRISIVVLTSVAQADIASQDHKVAVPDLTDGAAEKGAAQPS